MKKLLLLTALLPCFALAAPMFHVEHSPVSCVKLFGHCDNSDQCCGSTTLCSSHRCWTL